MGIVAGDGFVAADEDVLVCELTAGGMRCFKVERGVERIVDVADEAEKAGEDLGADVPEAFYNTQC